MENDESVRATFKARPRRPVTISDIIEEISAKFSMSLNYLAEVGKGRKRKQRHVIKKVRGLSLPSN